ncbi:MAG: hypothetical protein IKP43_05275 [Bacteroidaceae bacterium]|nr:hypothetical protein [Bacteroidaceae bacterium]
MKKNISHFLTAVVLLLSLNAGAQNLVSLTSLQSRWSSKNITNVSSGNIGVMLDRFDQTWPTTSVGDARSVIKQGLAKKVLEEETAYTVIYDAKNGYVEAKDGGADRQTMSACVWRRNDGHSLFAIEISQPVDPAISVVCFYDYNPKTKTLTPEPNLLQGWKPVENNGFLEYVLPRQGKELIINEWFFTTSEYYAHHFKWNGVKPVFEYYESLDNSVMDGGGPSMSFPVSFKGAKPGISDFVSAILAQDGLGEALETVKAHWTRRQQGRKLADGCSFTVDERNGYIRFEQVFSSVEKSYTEFCFWNCSDGKHKIVAHNVGCVMNNKPTETENTGLMFYTYDDETKELTYTSPYDMGASVEVTPVVTYQLPRVGKDIEAVIHAENRPVKILMKWNGMKFDQEQQ